MLCCGCSMAFTYARCAFMIRLCKAWQTTGVRRIGRVSKFQLTMKHVARFAALQAMVGPMQQTMCAATCSSTCCSTPSLTLTSPARWVSISMQVYCGMVVVVVSSWPCWQLAVACLHLCESLPLHGSGQTLGPALLQWQQSGCCGGSPISAGLLLPQSCYTAGIASEQGGCI